MRFFSFSSLRGRLLVLILSAVLPALDWGLYTGLEERLIQRSQVEENALRLTRLAAGDLVQAIEGARQLLVGLAQLPEVRPSNSAICSEVFADLLKQYPYYANLGVVDVNGNLFCSAQPVADKVNLTDNPYFHNALKTHEFTMSGFQSDKVTGRAVISFGWRIGACCHLVWG